MAQTEAEAGAETEIIGVIVKPIVSILENILLGKPMVNCHGDAAEVNDLDVKYKSIKTKVDVGGNHHGAPKVYHFA